jgi:hypothetical protein
MFIASTFGESARVEVARETRTNAVAGNDSLTLIIPSRN